MATKQYARAKQEIINFLQQAPKASNKIYTFSLACSSEKMARIFIHKMRVELSRLREEIQDQGKQCRPFKMFINKIEPVAVNVSRISLRYHDSNCAKVVEDVNNLFDVLSTGSNIIDEDEIRNK